MFITEYDLDPINSDYINDHFSRIVFFDPSGNVSNYFKSYNVMVVKFMNPWHSTGVHDIEFLKEWEIIESIDVLGRYPW